MRRIVLVIAMILGATFIATAQDIQYLDSLYSKQQEVISSLEGRIKDLEKKQTQQSGALGSLSNKVIEIDTEVGTLRDGLSGTNSNLDSAKSSLEGQIQETKTTAENEAQTVKKGLKSTMVIGGILAFVLLCIAILLHLLQKKRLQNSLMSIEDAHKAQDSLQVESVNLDNKILQIIDSQLKIQKMQPEQKEPDHSLALKVADEIVRIETNLSRMDASVKGYKQLAASVRRIKDNFSANGYEFVDMLGKEYNEGMKVIANFVPDDTLEEGKQIITGIIKPQINYNGVMIQAAQITVSQNI